MPWKGMATKLLQLVTMHLQPGSRAMNAGTQLTFSFKSFCEPGRQKGTAAFRVGLLSSINAVSDLGLLR